MLDPLQELLSCIEHIEVGAEAATTTQEDCSKEGTEVATTVHQDHTPEFGLELATNIVQQDCTESEAAAPQPEWWTVAHDRTPSGASHDSRVASYRARAKAAPFPSLKGSVAISIARAASKAAQTQVESSPSLESGAFPAAVCASQTPKIATNTTTPSGLSDGVQTELAEARWLREDGKWSKKYYKCNIVEKYVNDDGEDSFLVHFVQDGSRANVPSSHLRWLTKNLENVSPQIHKDQCAVPPLKKIKLTQEHTSIANVQPPRPDSLELDMPSATDQGLENLSDVQKDILKRFLEHGKKREREEMVAESAEEREARLPSPLDIPKFDERAHGTPLQWNDAKPLIWGRRTRNRPCFTVPYISTIEESLVRLKEFLGMRYDADGIPVLSKLHDRKEGDNQGWHRMRWVPYELAGSDDALPKTSEGPYGGGEPDWQKAWHGCKFEALYSIMYHGRLFASSDAARGERFFGKAPGVYVHKDGTCAKTANYFRFAPVFRDGVFWAALWEVMVDRADRVPVSKTDQWVQQERSVRLVALWLVGCTYDMMQPGWEVSEVWDPLLEANPLHVPSNGVAAGGPAIKDELRDGLPDSAPELPAASGGEALVCHLHLKRRKNCKYCDQQFAAGQNGTQLVEP